MITGRKWHSEKPAGLYAATSSCVFAAILVPSNDRQEGTPGKT
jgi:hypothetical protein